MKMQYSTSTLTQSTHMHAQMVSQKMLIRREENESVPLFITTTTQTVNFNQKTLIIINVLALPNREVTNGSNDRISAWNQSQTKDMLR